jgi:uncharacterized protein YecE (DUF72 family)
MIRIGTAGWSIPAALKPQFPRDGTQLENYAARMNAVEINSSFYRPHRRTTYERWAASVPQDFRFSVKLPRAITHERRLRDFSAPLRRFLDEVSGLGEKLGAILVQLPPSLAFDAGAAQALFAALAGRTIACEPRHATWFGEDAEALMRRHHVARVAADPPRHAQDGAPGGSADLAYYRWHGAPRVYWSAYSDASLAALGRAARAQRASAVWCIFDNTAAGAALADAMRLAAALAGTGTKAASSPYQGASKEEPHGTQIFQGRRKEGQEGGA